MYRNFFKKIRYVFLPFLFISMGYIAFCTLFYWYFVLEKELITIDDEALFTISNLLCWLVVFLWIKPRFQLLKIKDNNAVGRQMILIMFLIPINFLSQSIFKNNNDTLAVVNDISQLGKVVNNTNCYKIKDYIIERDIYKTYYKTNQLDDEFFSVKLYCVTPMFSSFEYDKNQIEALRSSDTLISQEDTILSLSFNQVKYWCCFSFYDRFKDRDYHKNQANINRFIEQSKMEIALKNFDHFSYFRKLGKGKDYRLYKKTLNKFEKFVPSNIILLLAEEEAFEEQNIKLERGLFWISLVGLISMILFIFIPSFNDEALSRFKMGRRPIANKSTFEKIIIPNKEIWVTQSVIYISLSIQLLMILNNVPMTLPSLSEIRPFGTSDGNLIGEGEYWRFITALFVNGGAISFYGLISFAFFGFSYEKNLGNFRFLLIILIIGIGTNMITYFINPNSHLFGFFYTVTGFAVFINILKLLKDKLFKSENLLGVLRLSRYILLISVISSLIYIESDFTLATFISIGIGILLGFILSLLNRLL